MGFSWSYGSPKTETEAVSVVRSAIERGVTFCDTSDAYGPFTNEVVVGKAIEGRREKVQLATKFGIIHSDSGLKISGRPEYIRAACENSLKRLNTDFIDLYYMHRVDKEVPIEVSVGEMKKLVLEGKVKYIGLSEASCETIRRAHHVHPISAVQIEWSLWTRDVEEDIVPLCRELGIGIVAYSPLGRGFFSGNIDLKNFELSDRRLTGNYPRFLPENLEKNKVIYEKLKHAADRRRVTPGQLSLAWVQNQGPDVVPIPGTTSIKHLVENIQSLTIKLSKEELKEISDIVGQVSGERYAESMLQSTYKHIETPSLKEYTI